MLLCYAQTIHPANDFDGYVILSHTPYNDIQLNQVFLRQILPYRSVLQKVKLFLFDRYQIRTVNFKS